MISEYHLELFELPWRRMRPRALFYALFSPIIAMEVARTARCLHALLTTCSNVHTGFPQQSLVYMRVLKELISVIASVALLSCCMSLPVCSAIMQKPVSLQGVHLHLSSLFECLPVLPGIDPSDDEFQLTDMFSVKPVQTC